MLHHSYHIGSLEFLTIIDDYLDEKKKLFETTGTLIWLASLFSKQQTMHTLLKKELSSYYLYMKQQEEEEEEEEKTK